NPIPPGTNAVTRTFGLNPHMGPLTSVWDQGRLAIAANVGPLVVPTTKAQYQNRSVRLPANLMSHNDQQSTWQAGAAEGARRRGGGALMAAVSLPQHATTSFFPAMPPAGNAVFLAGSNVVQYQLSTSQTAPAIRINSAAANTTTVFGAANGGTRVREIIRDLA